MRQKGLGPEEILLWCFENGMQAAIDVSVTPEDFEERQELAAAYPQLRLTAGIYPSEARRFTSEGGTANSILYRMIEEQLDHPLVVAIGEIGLDAFHDYAPMEMQRELFDAQLDLAKRRNLPVVIHNRDADLPTLESLRAAALPYAGMMHCFSSDYAAASQFVDMGFLISFAGNVTFKSSHDLQEVVRRLPITSLLIETDSPYLAPMPMRGRPNHPGYVGHTYEFVAALRAISVDGLVDAVQSNFNRLFGQKKDRPFRPPFGDHDGRSSVPD
jgi:TatD DNase family protein